MRTIAVSIDEPTIHALDRLAGRGRQRRKRSELVRQALSEFLARRKREAHEDSERAAYRRHRGRLARQARALVREQATP
ncbi:MAG: ribbon-helix-helix protein, CopG family [Acidobacteria bacterium]|nr:ribbon-helix-helix protein, CopG family [Acidobacteriota bacterium]